MTNEEIDLPVLAQLSEEQLSRIGVRTMGQRVRILNAARDALAASDQVENVIENQSVGLSESIDEEGEEEESEGEVDEEEVDEDGEEEGEVLEDDEEEEEDAVQFELVAKTTTTGKRTHIFNVGDNKYLSRGIKKNGQCFFYCNFISVHHKCTSSFRVRYQNIQNPMDEIPEIETEPSPHITTDGVHHVPDKSKRLREKVKEKVCEAIRICRSAETY